MRSTQPAFRQTEVFTWESESPNERPSEFSSSAVIRTRNPPSEFASSSFMDAAPHRGPRRPKRTFVHIVLVLIIAALCLVLFGVIGFSGLFA